MQASAANEHVPTASAKLENLFRVIFAIAKSGDLFDIEGLRTKLGVELRRTTVPLYQNGQHIGYVETYHPIGTASNYWLPPTEYELLDKKDHSADIGVQITRTEHASLQLNLASPEHCISGIAVRSIFGKATVLPAALPLDGPALTTTWRWKYTAHEAEPIQLDATFSPSGSDCIVALNLSQRRKVLSR